MFQVGVTICDGLAQEVQNQHEEAVAQVRIILEEMGNGPTYGGYTGSKVVPHGHTERSGVAPLAKILTSKDHAMECLGGFSTYRRLMYQYSLDLCVLLETWLSGI